MNDQMTDRPKRASSGHIDTSGHANWEASQILTALIRSVHVHEGHCEVLKQCLPEVKDLACLQAQRLNSLEKYSSMDD